MSGAPGFAGQATLRHLAEFVAWLVRRAAGSRRLNPPQVSGRV